MATQSPNKFIQSDDIGHARKQKKTIKKKFSERNKASKEGEGRDESEKTRKKMILASNLSPKPTKEKISKTKVVKKQKSPPKLSPKRNVFESDINDGGGNANIMLCAPTIPDHQAKLKLLPPSLASPEVKKKKLSKKKLVTSRTENGKAEFLFETALKRISYSEMENPLQVVLVSGEPGIGKKTWVEAQANRILQDVWEDGKNDDSKFVGHHCFPVLCRGQAEKTPLLSKNDKTDFYSEYGKTSVTGSTDIGCAISRPPMHAITEALNHLIRVLTSCSSPFKDETKSMLSNEYVYGGKALWAKRFSDTLGVAEASYLASTGLVPELGVLLDLPGFGAAQDSITGSDEITNGSKRKQDKKPALDWDCNTPFKFHRSCIAIRDLLRTVSESCHPIIMIINDLDQADEDTCRLLNFLVADDPKHYTHFSGRNDKELLIAGEVGILESDSNSRLQNFLLVGTIRTKFEKEKKICSDLEYSVTRRRESDIEEAQRHALNQRENSQDKDIRKDLEEISQLTRVCLGPFGREKVSKLAQSYLYEKDSRAESNEPREVQKLTETILEWTGGNTLFILHVFEYLKENVTISSSSYGENLDEVQAQFYQDKNSLKGLLGIRIDRLPKAVRFAIVNASAFRQTQISFSTSQLFRLFKAAYVSSGIKKEIPFKSPSELKRALQRACDLKFLENVSQYGLNNTDHWAFSHSLIRDAAFDIFNKNDNKMEIHLRYGIEASKLAIDLKSVSTNEERNAFKYLAADQLTIAGDVLDRDRDSAVLFLVETAEMCVAKSAFCTAIGYLNIGIEILKKKQECFSTENRGICFRMYILMARLKSMHNQNEDDSEKFLKQLLENSKTLKDEVTVRQTQISILMSKRKFQEAMEKTITTLDLLDEKIPRHGDFADMISRQFQKLIQASRRKDDSNLFQPVLCADKKVFDVMSLLSDLCKTSSHCGRNSYGELAMIRSTNLCLKYGFTRQYPLSFAYFGASLMKQAFLSDNLTYAKEGFRIGHICEKTARVNDFYGAQSLAIFHFYISHWRRPYRRSLGQILSVYNAQLKSGDYSNIELTMFTYIQYHLASGFDLTKLDDNLQLFGILYQDYRMNDYWKIQLIQKFVLNMLGETSSPSLLLGYSEEEQKSKITQMKESGANNAVQFTYFLLLFSAVFFQNHDMSRACLDEISFAAVMPIWRPWIIFFDCLTAIGTLSLLENKNTRKKMKEEINEKKEQLIDWFNEGAVNCSAMISLIEAELSVEDSLGKKPLSGLKIQKFYDDAITIARRQELKHVEALCLERASIRLEAATAKTLSVEYIAKAHQCYLEWNAIAKAVDIEERHSFKLKLSRREKRVGLGYARQNSGLRYNPNQTIGGGHKEIKSINIKDAIKTAEKVKGMMFGKSRSDNDKEASLRDKFARMSSLKMKKERLTNAE